jgi:hypothetical protein
MILVAFAWVVVRRSVEEVQWAKAIWDNYLLPRFQSSFGDGVKELYLLMIRSRAWGLP